MKHSCPKSAAHRWNIKNHSYTLGWFAASDEKNSSGCSPACTVRVLSSKRLDCVFFWTAVLFKRLIIWPQNTLLPAGTLCLHTTVTVCGHSPHEYLCTHVYRPQSPVQPQTQTQTQTHLSSVSGFPRLCLTFSPFLFFFWLLFFLSPHLKKPGLCLSIFSSLFTVVVNAMSLILKEQNQYNLDLSSLRFSRPTDQCFTIEKSKYAPLIFCRTLIRDGHVSDQRGCKVGFLMVDLEVLTKMGTIQTKPLLVFIINVWEQTL